MKLIFTKTIKIPRNTIDQIDHDLSDDVDLRKIAERYSNFSTLTWTARFDNDIEVDIKLCCGDLNGLESNPLWTETVLFQHNCEVVCTEPSDRLTREWTLETDNAIYRIDIKPENKCQDHK